MRWKLTDRNPQKGGDVGGDTQAADSWSVRFVGDQHSESSAGRRLYSVLTVYAYAASQLWKTVITGPWHVTTQVEMTVCTDPNRPGDTEVWSDAKYIDDQRTYTDIDEADRAARDLADRYVRDGRPPVDWDGHAPRGGLNHG